MRPVNVNSFRKFPYFSYKLKKALLYFFCCFILCGHAQNKMDSLLAVLKATHLDDTNKVNTLLSIIDNCAEEDILKYSEQAYQLSQKLNFKLGIAKSAGNMAYGYFNQGQIDRALEYFLASLKMLKELNDHKEMASAYNNIGYILKSQGENDRALDYYLEALHLLEKTDNKKWLPFFLDNIGEIYSIKNEFTKALSYHERALKLREGSEGKKGLDASYSYFGVTYHKMGQIEKALEYFHKALEIRQVSGEKHAISNAANNIGALYFKQKKYAEAEKYCKLALETAQEIGFPESVESASKHLSFIYNATGNYKEAFKMHELYKLMSDSILNENTRNSSIKKDLQYQFEKKEEAAKQEAQIKEAVHIEEIKRQKLIYISISGAIVLGLVSVLLLFNRKRLKEKNRFQEQLNQQQKEQANAVMETQESERKRIAEDLHDSLGHLLSTVKLNLQTQPVQQTQVDGSLSLLNQASEEIRNITFNLMPRTLEEGGLIPALNELASKITNTGTVKVLLHVHDMEKFVLEKQSQFNIYRIVQEAVNNILKHAAATEINIQVIGQKDHITIMIEDDGKGFNPETSKGGRGLKNIVTRSLWLKGNINIDSTPGKGTTITTEFPI